MLTYSVPTATDQWHKEDNIFGSNITDQCHNDAYIFAFNVTDQCHNDAYIFVSVSLISDKDVSIFTRM
jgi:hypothetical protein